MDHVPLPKDPVRSPPRIPYYCLEEYDRGDFNTYPERQEWTKRELFTESTWTDRGGANGRSQRAVAAFLQQWLFFGLLHAAFGDDIVFQDYIDEENGTRYIHTRNLLAHAHEFISRRNCGLVTETDLQHLDHSLQTAHPMCYFLNMGAGDALGPYFLVSLSLLGRFITHLRRILFQDYHILDSFAIEVWVPPFMRSDSVRFQDDELMNRWISLFEHEMVKERWCPRAVDMQEQLFGLEYRYYTSFLSNVQQDRQHRGVCTRRQCLASQMRKSTYRTVHTSNRCRCPFQGFEQAAIEKTLEAGNLPLVAWDCSKKVASLISEKFDATYVAISHVWSDGLGNPYENAMPQCQLEVLNNLVQNLYPGTAEPIPFWIDTLCCPATSSKGRRVAIRKMRDTYACANTVLALDKGLRSIDTTGRSVTELAFYIYLSTWSSRLWTFQESALPETLIFQFLNDTFDVEQILSTVKKYSCSLTDEWGSIPDIGQVYISIRGDHRHLEQPYKPPKMNLRTCAIALSRRTTSVQEDESLCLASLMAIDPAPLLSVSPQDRMRHFWAQLPHISEYWMYYQHSRLDFVGFRWAPKTLLGTGFAGGRASDDTRASPTKDGLLVNAYSITLSSLNFPLRRPIGGEAWIRGTDDHWGYYIQKHHQTIDAQGFMHFTVPKCHFSRIALLMTSMISNLEVMHATSFVMVFVTEEHDGVTYARRGDSGLIFDADHPAAPGQNFHTVLIRRKEHFLGARPDSVAREGENYLIDDQYGAVVGDWTDEKSKWCID